MCQAEVAVALSTKRLLLTAEISGWGFESRHSCITYVGIGNYLLMNVFRRRNMRKGLIRVHQKIICGTNEPG